MVVRTSCRIMTSKGFPKLTMSPTCSPPHFLTNKSSHLTPIDLLADMAKLW